MSDITPHPGAQSPFDAIRRTRADGTYFWDARDLQGVTEYSRWEDFAKLIDRAMAAARNTGENVEQAFSAITEKGAGRPRASYELSRFAAYASQSTAKKRADLLESYGATAVVERSTRIEWPAS